MKISSKNEIITQALFQISFYVYQSTGLRNIIAVFIRIKLGSICSWIQLSSTSTENCLVEYQQKISNDQINNNCMILKNDTKKYTLNYKHLYINNVLQMWSQYVYFILTSLKRIALYSLISLIIITSDFIKEFAWKFFGPVTVNKGLTLYPSASSRFTVLFIIRMKSQLVNVPF